MLAGLLALLVATIAYPPPGARAEQPPATPSSVTVTRADGTLTASWPAVDGATGYHITYSSDGKQSWSLAAYDHPTASITIDGVTNSATYVVGVRALNASGGSGWRNSAPSAPFTAPPATPSSVTVTRADGTLTATWPAVQGATGYHITYSSNGRQSWSLAAYDHPTASITIDNASNSATYYVAVRALNSAGGSGWRNSAPSTPFTPPPPATPSSVAVLRSDGTLTASWPAVQGATGYHITYSSNGRQSWSLAAYDHPTASITIDNVANSSTYYVGVRALNASGGSGWRNSPAAGPWESPGTPDNLTVEPGDGYLDISWDAVTGATGYDVRAKAEGSTAWHDVAANITATSHRYTTTTTLDHIAVRARSNGNAGPWAEISRMPSEDFWTAYNAETAGVYSLSGAEGYASAEAQAASNKLGKVTWGTITRTTRGHNAVFSVQWTPVTGADGYNFVCSEHSGWHWDLCGWGVSNSNTTISYATVPTSKLQPLSITHHWRKDGPHTPGKYTLGSQRDIMLAVRAVKNNDPSAAGPWAQTEEIPPFLPSIWGFSHTRGDSQISMTWNAKPHVTGYNIHCAVAVPGASGDYTLCATLSDQVWTPGGQVSATISNWTADGTNYSIDNTKKYDFAIVSTNKWSAGRWLPPLMEPITLTSSKVGETTATLTLAEYTGSWWLQSTASGATCESKGTAAATGATEDLTGLTPGASYTYTAYSDSACTNVIVSAAAFTTLSVPSVSNLTATAHSTGTAVYSNNHSAAAFTTGSSANGYTLKRVTVKIGSVGSSPGNLTVAVHASSSGDPASAATHTLTGSDPTGSGDYTFTCSGGCGLSASTDYFLVLKGTGAASSNAYTWQTTASASEVNTPSNFGWSIADTGKRYSSSSWADETGGRTGMFKVSATIDPVLTVTGVSGSGATLNIAHHDVTSWYYKATTGPHTTCQGPVTANSKTLTGLSAGTSYTYSAYSDSTCTSNNLLATAAAFTTTLPAPSGLSLSFNSGALKMQASWNKPSGATGAVGYELQHADSDRNNPYGSTTTIAATSAATVTHQFNNSLTIKFRVRAVVGSTKSAWAEHVA